MKHVYVVRHDRRWGERQLISPLGQRWHLRSFHDLWNKLFSISYKPFRSRLNDIRESNFSQIKGLDDRIDSWDIGKYQHEGVRFYATDDDDWFHPNIVEALRPYPQKVIVWDYVEFSGGKLVRLKKGEPGRKFLFESNNYVMDAPCEEPQLMAHDVADRGIKDAFVIDEALSIQNRTPASLTMYCFATHRARANKTTIADELVQEMRRCQEWNGEPLPGFEKCFERMVDLYREVKVL